MVTPLLMLVWLQLNHGVTKIAESNKNEPNGIASYFSADLPKLSVNIYIKARKITLRVGSKPTSGKVKKEMIATQHKS